uniref:Uncharacterized protein n=1 Tax=Triticum urartu TaxID=4572 RepID=A0A8R7PAJ7_TRIUA
MASKKWSQATHWALPFFGRAEHVPELGLWFGLSARNPFSSLCALDLSAMDPGSHQSCSILGIISIYPGKSPGHRPSCTSSALAQASFVLPPSSAPSWAPVVCRRTIQTMKPRFTGSVPSSPAWR